MTIDEQGNVYLTGNGVTVFNKNSKKIEHIDVPEKWTANICFGGADMRTLFITASKGLYSMKMQVKGAGRQSAPLARSSQFELGAGGPGNSRLSC